MKWAHEILTLRTKHPFTIARGGSSEFRVVWVRATDSDGNDGWGEASPSRFYGETADTVAAVLPRLTAAIDEIDPWSLEEIEQELDRTVRFNGAAKSGVSAALHDLAAKRLGVPLWKMWGLDPARAPRSSFTIGIGDSADIAQKVAEADEYPILKVKLGSSHDEEILQIVRDTAPDKVLRVDANAAWTAKQALRMMDVLVRHRVEGRRHIYQPAQAKDQASRSAWKRLTKTFFGGNPGKALITLLDESRDRLDEKELDELQRWVSAQSKRRKAGKNP